jgi:hypothetical protein
VPFARSIDGHLAHHSLQALTRMTGTDDGLSLHHRDPIVILGA